MPLETPVADKGPVGIAVDVVLIHERIHLRDGLLDPFAAGGVLRCWIFGHLDGIRSGDADVETGPFERGMHQGDAAFPLLPVAPRTGPVAVRLVGYDVITDAVETPLPLQVG